jgi:hypothetical protein
LREVDGMPPLPTQPIPQPPWWLAILETCPPGEGMVWLDLLR